MHAVYRNGKYEVKSSLFHFSCSSRQEVSARRIVVKRQVTVATLMVSSSVMLSSCVADIGTRSASEETTKVDEAGGISSTDGAGGTNGDAGDDADDNQRETAHTNGGENAGGAGQPGEAGATGSGDNSGVLPPLGEFDPADPSFELFDPCTEIPYGRLEASGIHPEPVSVHRESGWSFCGFRGSEARYGEASITLASKNLALGQETIKFAGEPILTGENLPLVAYLEDGPLGRYCSAFLETKGGTVKVSFSNRQEGAVETSCENAEQIFEDLTM